MSLLKDKDLVKYSNSSSQETPGNTIINGYEFVDLGLSVKWATCNIGATKPEEYGWYFMWGDTTAYNSDRTPVGGGAAISFGWGSYPLCNGSTKTITKYCTHSYYGNVDNKIILELQDDAACAHINGSSRMPTKAEFQELIDACNTEWVTNYNGTDINGQLFTLKADSSKQLFFPATGYLAGSAIGDDGLGSDYYSNCLHDTNSEYTWVLHLSPIKCTISDRYRYYGNPVRAVLPK